MGPSVRTGLPWEGKVDARKDKETSPKGYQRQKKMKKKLEHEETKRGRRPGNIRASQKLNRPIL